MLTKEKLSAKTFVKAAAVVPIVMLLVMIMSFNQRVLAIESNSDWWQQILEKHHLFPLNAYNNFENVFEMAEHNSINNRISTSTNAVLIIKGNKNDYMIVDDYNSSPATPDDIQKASEIAAEMAEQNLVNHPTGISSNGVLMIKGNKNEPTVIDDHISTSSEAAMIINRNNNYMIIEAEQVDHDLKSGMLKVKAGTVKTYHQDSDISKPLMELKGDISINLRNVDLEKLY